MDSLGHKNVSHTPEVLCVAERFPWKVGVWKQNQEKFEQVKRNVTKILKAHHYGVKHAPKGYIASVGTCRGDSGGPLYVKEYDADLNTKYIIAGHNFVHPIKNKYD